MVRSSFDGFEKLTNLSTLILDKNGLESMAACPPLPALKELWFNNNQVHNLTDFMNSVAQLCPGLTTLSLMRNPAAPPMVCLSQEDVSAAARYRLYIIYRMPSLSFLDAAPVTAAERAEAKAKGKYYEVKKSASAVARGSSAASAAASGAAAHATSSSSHRASGLDGGLSSSGGHALSQGEYAAAGGSHTTTATAAPSSPSSAASSESKPGSRKPSAYLAFSKNTYDGKHSEGNRFITGDQL